MRWNKTFYFKHNSEVHGKASRIGLSLLHVMSAGNRTSKMVFSFFLFFFLKISFMFIFLIFLLLFNYSCPHFFPITLPCPTHPPPPTFNPPLLSLSMGPLYTFLYLTLPLFPPRRHFYIHWDSSEACKLAGAAQLGTSADALGLLVAGSLFSANGLSNRVGGLLRWQLRLQEACCRGEVEAASPCKGFSIYHFC